MESGSSIGRRIALVVGLLLVVVAVVLVVPHIPRGSAGDGLGDRRPFLGIPNFLDVVSNVPFLIVGVLGLRFVLGRGSLAHRWERVASAVLFGGIAWVGVGSSYYHLAPENERLMWDRLPISIAFMAVLALVLGDRVSPRLGAWLLAPLVFLGAGSVLYWHFGELRGAGDLRPYAVVQYGTLAALPLLIVLFRPTRTGSAHLVVALGFYGLAKVFEIADGAIFSMGHVVSGHTLKHLSAAAATYCLLRMMQTRRALS